MARCRRRCRRQDVRVRLFGVCFLPMPACSLENSVIARARPMSPSCPRSSPALRCRSSSRLARALVCRVSCGI